MNQPVQSSKTGLWVVSAIILTGLLVGGGVYAWQKQLLVSTKQDLQRQIDSLQKKVDETKKEDNTSSNPTSTPIDTTGNSKTDNSTSSNPQTVTATYKNEEYEFEFKYPKNFAIDTNVNTSTRAYEKLLSVNVGTKEYVDMLKKADAVEILRYFRIDAAVPKDKTTLSVEGSAKCPSDAIAQVGTLYIGGLTVAKCKVPSLGGSALKLDFTKDEIIMYTIVSDDYFSKSKSDQQVIDEMINSFRFIQIQ